MILSLQERVLVVLFRFAFIRAEADLVIDILNLCELHLLELFLDTHLAASHSLAICKHHCISKFRYCDLMTKQIILEETRLMGLNVLWHGVVANSEGFA